MASLPSQASRRRSSPSEQSASSPPQASIESPSSQRESDSQFFVINNPRVTQKIENTPAPSTVQESATIRNPPQQELLTCWICQLDSSEDEPGAEWRRPCPCSLTAHDACMLEWISSKEAPKPGEIGSSQKFVCPQCQAPIQIERPRDLIVLGTEYIQRAAKSIVLPTALSSVIGIFYSGFLVYGSNAIQIVFGPEDAAALMTPSAHDLRVLELMRTRRSSQILQKIIKCMDPFLPAPGSLANWKLYVGLPAIAPLLVLSRLRIADRVFAVLPITYFLFHPTAYLDMGSWPPTPAFTFAVLPYFRSCYNEIYRFTFSDLEKKWDAAVQRRPREGETAEDIAEAQAGREGGGMFNLELEFLAEDEEVDIPAPDAPAAEQARRLRAAAERNAQQAVPDNAERPQNGVQPPAEANQPVPGAFNQAAPAADNPPPLVPLNNPAPNAQPRARNISTLNLANTVVGALLFPAISSLMGDLLKLTLPTKYVGKSVGRFDSRFGIRIGVGAKGLLQQQWGRTIVGGCLFVVLKDAIVLYCKWKKARDFGKKRVVDYVGRRRGDVVRD